MLATRNVGYRNRLGIVAVAPRRRQDFRDAVIDLALLLGKFNCDPLGNLASAGFSLSMVFRVRARAPSSLTADLED